jgi:hypothetical protein
VGHDERELDDRGRPPFALGHTGKVHIHVISGHLNGGLDDNHRRTMETSARAKTSHYQGALQYLINHDFEPVGETDHAVESLTWWANSWFGVVVDFERGQVELVQRENDEMLPHRVHQSHSITSPADAFAAAIEFRGLAKTLAGQ